MLQVAAAGVRILLPGDIEGAGEGALVARAGKSLASSVLVLPHHGSDTSSGASFLDAVGACVALLSRGHRNRFGFPDPRVLQRLTRRGVEWLDTAVHGAIEVRFASDGSVKSLQLARLDGRRFWQRLSADGARQRRAWLDRVASGHTCLRSFSRGEAAAASSGAVGSD